jgi:tryptophan-rich sensory protein
MSSALALIGFLALCFGAAAFGAAFPPGEWYAGLTRPGWTPPNWLFGPVWTTLYVMIAVAGWLVWREGASPGRRTALLWYGLQLLLNALWSWLFFGLESPALGFADIFLLLAAIGATILAFRPVSRTAAWLLLPYLLWVGYASALNFAIWRLNA